MVAISKTRIFLLMDLSYCLLQPKADPPIIVAEPSACCYLITLSARAIAVCKPTPHWLYSRYENCNLNSR